MGMPDNTIQLIATLNELMVKPLDKVTGDELRWMMKVHKERPAWAIATLNRLANHSA